MDTAINKTTGDTINAIEVYKNGSYQNPKRGEWSMPQDSVENYNECSEEDLHIHPVKSKDYKNKWGTSVWVSPCFAKYPGSAAKTVAESEEHKKLKNWMFTKMKNDDLQFIYSKSSKKYKFDNYVKLSELDINWNKYNIEVRTKGYKSLQADILLQFNNKHPMIGNGIFIEIQLSKQSKKETYDRSFGRALHGYSTAWLFQEDFLFDEDTKDIQLKEDKLTLFSFSSELKYSGAKFVSNLQETVKEQCIWLDDKIKESNSNSEDINTEIEVAFNNVNNKLLCTKENSLKEINNKEADIINKIRNLEENPFEKVVEKYRDDINNQLEDFRNQVLTITYNSIGKIKKEADDKMKEVDETYPRVIDCPKCGAIMIFKITPLKQKELYDCIGCAHAIWVK